MLRIQWKNFQFIKNNFLRESLFLQHIMILIIVFCNLENFILTGELPRTTNFRSLQSRSKNSKSFSKYLFLHMV